MSFYYLKRGTKVVGPYDLKKILEGMSTGSVLATDAYSHNKNGPWLPCSSIAQHSAASTPSLATPAGTNPPAKPLPEDNESDYRWRDLMNEVWHAVRDHYRTRAGSHNSATASRNAAEKGTRQADGIISPTFAILTAGLLGLGGLLFWRLNAVTSMWNSSVPTVGASETPSGVAADLDRDDSHVTISRRYRDKFQELYDQVKGGLAEITGLQRRDMPQFAANLKKKAELLPPEDSNALRRVGGKLRSAAGSLAGVAEVFYSMGKTDVALGQSNNPYEVGGMSAETRALYEKAASMGRQQMQVNMSEATRLLQEIEADPLFKKLMR